MATATRARSAPAPAAIVPATMTHESLMALLGATGSIAQGGEFHRMTLAGGVLETSDGDMFPPQKPGIPALTVRIVKPPVYYTAFFLADDEKNGAVDPNRIGRPDLNKRFSRKYDDPTAQAEDTNPANEVYDQIAAATGKRGNFKADIELQIVPESGEMTGQETTYILSLSTTSVFEWRGSSRDPGKGAVSDTTFMVRLAQLAIQQAVEAGGDEAAQQKAVLDALTSLRLGGVIADVYLLRAENDEKTNTWWVISFVPTHIEPVGDTPALESGSSDDVPF